MKIALIGLGRMGLNMAKRLIAGGHEVNAYNRSEGPRLEAKKAGAAACATLTEAVSGLDSPAICWLMLPAGEVTEEYITQLSEILKNGDIIVEGGNSYYKDDIRRQPQLAAKGIRYADAGVSGGVWGLKNGYAIMIGGEKETFEIIEPIVKTLAPEGGYMYCGKTGAGHFTKMVHNAIEYAMMESYGEGFELLRASEYGKEMDLCEVSKMWQNGSVIRSWLLELLSDAFKKDPGLEKISGYVEDSGEARYALKEAADLGVAADAIAVSLFKRFNSRQKDVFANKVTAALRNSFGGHMTAGVREDIRKSSAGAGAVKHASPEKK